MGWKASTIIINPRTEINYESLLLELGYKNLKKINEEPFEVAINPEDEKVYIGVYKNNLLICEPKLPMTFFENNISSAEKILINKFPNSEICSIVLHSGVNLWCYSVTKNGKKIRARAGNSDDGRFVEIGEPLEQEIELLSKSTIEEDGSRSFLFEESPDEPLTEDQVGENFVFEICSRYFGKPLDRADDLLFETFLTGYDFSGNSFIKNDFQEKSKTDNVKGKKPWWKIW